MAGNSRELGIPNQRHSPGSQIKIADAFHERFVGGCRTRKLTEHLAPLMPIDANVLDVGCGDGEIARAIWNLRPDLDFRGIDVLVRDDTAIPVDSFDGERIPHADNTFDVVTLIDVLHHTEDPLPVLEEARRVSGGSVVIKDHLLSGVLAKNTLRLMDAVGNKRHGVALPYNYLTRSEWDVAFDQAGMEIEIWLDRLSIYPWPATLMLDRGLHFITSLTVNQD
jgi:SAM-dependent methyltransferase